MKKSSDHAVATITPELLTLHQTAQLCGVSDRTLFNWSRSGVSPASIKFGSSKSNAVRYSRTAYQEWLASGCKPVKQNGVITPVSA
jgi:predicted DNA-binding transcriptional regulator AlpA